MLLVASAAKRLGAKGTLGAPEMVAAASELGAATVLGAGTLVPTEVSAPQGLGAKACGSAAELELQPINVRPASKAIRKL